MLDQLIYTRCSPQRDLKSKGQVVHDDGFGVFSMSPELFSNERLPSYDFLQARLAVPNGAKENSPVGLFNSYEYAMAAPGVYTFSYEVARPRCQILRANGKGHRAGTYIKQCLIGDIEGYPAEWFGSAVWDAHLRSENDYYLDSAPHAEPPWLSQVSSTPANGSVGPSRVKEFVSDGREEAVKAGIWFLVREFGKPEGERKVLLIKDTPDHVELWIAAIEYGFSASMAQKITFTTNRSKLGTQADSALFYYTDATGRYHSMMNRSVPQTRHPYCMIVGYHPKDIFCSALKQTPASSFVIIDGTAKTISFQPDDTIRMPYYSAAVRYDADIQDFCNVVLPSLPLHEPTGNLPRLFDAYKYLLDSGHRSDKWNYADTLRHFAVLLQYGVPGSPALNNYLIDECLAAYPRFGSEDERRGYTLLKYMWNIAKAVGRERDITGCAADIAGNALNALTDRSNRITAMWQALNASGAVRILQPALRDLFNDTELTNYTRQFKNSDPASVETALNMFFCMLDTERLGAASIGDTNETYSFVCMAIVQLMDDHSRLSGALRKLNAAPDLFNRISMSVAQYLEKYEPVRITDWWNAILDVCGSDVIKLCRKLCDSRSASIEMVEQLLVNRLEQARRFDPDLGAAFGEAIARLGAKPDTGKRLFGACVQMSQPDDFAGIIRAIQKCNVDRRVEEEIFRLMDSRLPYDAAKNVDPAVCREIRRWASSLDTASRSVTFYEFKRNFERARKAEKAVDLACAFAGMRFTANEGFLTSDSFADIAAVSAGFCDADLHIALLCLFQGIDGTTMDRYADAYAAGILSVTKNRNMAVQLISLCEAAMYKFTIPGRSAAFVSDMQRSLDASLEKQLAEYYKPALVEQVSQYGDCDQNVRKKLILLLKNAGEKARPKGLSGLWNNLFGKR